MRLVRSLLFVYVAASSGTAALGQAWTPPSTLDRQGLTTLVGKQGARPANNAPADGYWGGWLLGGPAGTLSHRYAIAEYQVHGRRYVTFDSVVARGAKPVWMTIDAVWIPPLAESLEFSRACAHQTQLESGDMNPDRAIMGIAVFEAAQFFSKVLFAWRADTTTHRFEIVSPADLRCYNEGFEVD